VCGTLAGDDSCERRRKPTTVAVTHAKGGVGKTTTTLIVGKYLSRQYRVELRDYDESQHLSFLVAEMAPDERALTHRLWLNGDDRRPDVVLIDSAPARGPPKPARPSSKQIKS
jgi:hypothetical protein